MKYNDKELENKFRTVVEDEAVGIPWLEDRTILLAPTGSRVYGTSLDNGSDKDYRGICIPPKSYFLGLNYFNEYNNVGGKNFKTKEDEVDLTVQHINKFVKDALKGVPNNIEILFLEPSQYAKVTELGKVLIDNRKLFLSKTIKEKYNNYAETQMQNLEVKKNKGTGRVELIEKYGYDTKFFYHAVRLLTSAIEILRKADYTTARPNGEYLKECRLGKYTLDEARDVIRNLQQEMDEAYASSTLPVTPDLCAVNKLLTEINERALSSDKFPAL